MVFLVPNTKLEYVSEEQQTYGFGFEVLASRDPRDLAGVLDDPAWGVCRSCLNESYISQVSVVIE